eukprot:scaffold38009_cov57-Phaeocystis_antarctica.AAC.1
MSHLAREQVGSRDQMVERGWATRRERESNGRGESPESLQKPHTSYPSVLVGGVRPRCGGAPGWYTDPQCRCPPGTLAAESRTLVVSAKSVGEDVRLRSRR